MFPLYAATNLLQRLYKPLLEPLGLTYAQYLVVLVLSAQAPISVGELGACLHLDIGTLSPLLKRMERAGCIKRRRDADDKRRARLNCISHLLTQIPYGDVAHPPVHLPDRERHDDYTRHPVPPGMFVPSVF